MLFDWLQVNSPSPHDVGFDMAMMTLPASKGAGNFIMHYNWAGYYDCVDIAVLPPQPDGTPAVPENDFAKFGYMNDTVSHFERVDHCQVRRSSLRRAASPPRLTAHLLRPFVVLVALTHACVSLSLSLPPCISLPLSLSLSLPLSLSLSLPLFLSLSLSLSHTHTLSLSLFLSLSLIPSRLRSSRGARWTSSIRATVLTIASALRRWAICASGAMERRRGRRLRLNTVGRTRLQQSASQSAPQTLAARAGRCGAKGERTAPEFVTSLRAMRRSERRRRWCASTMASGS